MAMVAQNANLGYGMKAFSYDTVGAVQISDIVRVAMVAVKQLPGTPTMDTEFMTKEVFMKLGMKNSTWPGGTIGYGWTSDLDDMGRVGTMLAHDGWYGGERFMEASWVYRMSHPAFEDSNAAYGQLAWLANRGGGNSFGYERDDCSPAAFWPSYPHVGSESPDCHSDDGNCKQKYDIGEFDAAGLGGQFVIVHPGLDLVITGHNATNGATGLWNAVRPGIVAKDPMFNGDEAAFCKAYGAGDYAPDLLAPRIAPTK
jgi:CubicO group peptidase (beta-lactamase class C family)